MMIALFIIFLVIVVAASASVTVYTNKKKEKEQKPVIRMKTDGNRIRIEISPDIPFQILSFRINGKECDFYWQGKKLLAELPKKSRNPWKAELMGFVKSGKLYYETMDLPEKQ